MCCIISPSIELCCEVKWREEESEHKRIPGYLDIITKHGHDLPDVISSHVSILNRDVLQGEIKIINSETHLILYYTLSC